MFYYIFKFNPEGARDFTEILNFLDHFTDFEETKLSKYSSRLIARSRLDLGPEILEYAKENMRLNFSYERHAEGLGPILVEYDAKQNIESVHFLLQLFPVDHMFKKSR